jgi:hypothetical protein
MRDLAFRSSGLGPQTASWTASSIVPARLGATRPGRGRHCRSPRIGRGACWRPYERAHYEPENVSVAVRRTELPARVESYAYADGQIRALAEDVGVRGRRRAGRGRPPALRRHRRHLDGRRFSRRPAPNSGWRRPAPNSGWRRSPSSSNSRSATLGSATSSRPRGRACTPQPTSARRCAVRGLHDGAQQRLLLALHLAQELLRGGRRERASVVGEALEHAREGIHRAGRPRPRRPPRALTHGCLGVGMDAVVARMDMPVRLDVWPPGS